MNNSTGGGPPVHNFYPANTMSQSNISKVSPTPANPHNLVLRNHVVATDEAAIRDIVTSTQRFSAAEIDIAAELVRETLNRGAAAGYQFCIAEDEAGRPVAYSCFGEIPCTVGSYDLYWIAVEASLQGGGIGRWLMAITEDAIRRAGGRAIFLDTSGRADYAPTRTFYERCHYTRAARLANFYNTGDDKIIYTKLL